MKKRIVFILISIVSLGLTNSHAQTIEMKKSGLGYRYYSEEKQLDEDEFEHLLSSNQKASDLYYLAKQNRKIGSVFGFAAGFSVGWQLVGLFKGEDIKPVFGVTTLGLITVGVIIQKNGDKQTKKAIDIYNTGLPDSNSESYLWIQSTGDGVGLVWQF